MQERRKEARYVVDGLDIYVDGVRFVPIDVSPSAVRLFCLEGDHPNGRPLIRFVSHIDALSLDSVVRGWFIRATPSEIVFGYPPPVADWQKLLASFDTFADLWIDVLDSPVTVPA